MRTITRLALSAGLIGLAACAPLPPPGVLFVAVGPPAYYRPEVVGVAPGPGYVFIRGYWDWQGSAYAWVPGRWEQRPYPHAQWIAPRWRHTREGWYREGGHWRGRGGRD
jgi:WXXGXW repeat (2 copies)